MMRKIGVVIAAFILLYEVKAQEVLYYINEGFENPETRVEWISSPVDEIIKWKYQNGGDNDLPPYAYEGSVNAFFAWFDFSGPTYRLLESPAMDLSDASKPQLTFAHAQHTSLGQDELMILFKAGPSANWDTVEHYDAATPLLLDYEMRLLNIDEYGSKYLCDGFQVGFLGIGNGGNGVCIDAVVIEEMDYIPKFIKTAVYENVSHSIIPAGIDGLPVQKTYLNVFGNMGQMILDSISFTSNSTNDSDFKDLGFNLYHTRSSLYRNLKDGVSTKIAGPVSISGGVVTFNGLNDTLFTGDNYLWLTIDVKSSAIHDNTVDFYLDANSIKVNDTLLPAVATNPAGQFTIKESVLFDNFETASGWTLEGDFEEDVPQGFTVNLAKDPDYAYSGSKILGTDLITDGGYILGITPATAYFATTPELNLKYYNDIRLFAHKWLSFNASDDITIDISTDGGTNWQTIWERQIDLIVFNENRWSEFYLTDKINSSAARQESFMLRLAMNQTHPTYVLGGWNLDDFSIVGNHLETDLGITEIITPYSDCMGTNNDTVKIIIKNYAEGNSPAIIPVYFTLNGPAGERHYDTITSSIAQDDSIVFIFDELANFVAGGDVDFFVSIDLIDDEDSENNFMSKPLFIQNNLSSPYAENFEEGGGYWKPSPDSKWQCIVPSGGVPALPESPNSWFLAPTGFYNNNDTSSISSSCYDMTGEDILIAELKYWNESEYGIDGANLQYSVDDEQSWIVVDSTSFGVYSNWYTEPVSTLGDIGWSGNTGGWVTAREFLPSGILFEPKVKFRIYWSSDAANAARGFVFDDFKIYPAPVDIGVTAIVTPVDACQNINDGSVTLSVKNFGVNKMYTGDTVIVGINLDSNPPVFDTAFLVADLLPGDSIALNFDVSLDLTEAKSYTIVAYTIIEDDPFFYSPVCNDTTDTVFTIWPNPVTELPDTISSRIPKNLIIRPYESTPPGYTFLWYDSSVADTHTVDKSDVYYSVTVTEPEHSCETDDSVFVLLLFNDVGVDSILSPVSDCELSDNDTIRIHVRNMGTDSLFASDEIVVYYSVNGGTVYRDTIVLQENLSPNSFVVHSFVDDVYDFTLLSAYEIKSWAFFAGDTVNTNDSSNRTISVYGYPEINLGSDKSIAALDYILDAGSGYNAYLWNTAETTQSININTSGNYWIRVENEYGCPAYDTVYIWFSIRDLLAYNIINPVNGCYSGNPENITVSVLNNGTDTLKTSETININYQINGGGIVSETTNLSQNIVPGQYGAVTFSTKAILSEGVNTIQFWINNPGDLRTDNDSILVNIDRAAAPVVDLGPDRIVVTISTVLDAGSGANYAYLWQDGSTDRTFTAVETETYSCQVTDMNTGCYASDTVNLDFDYTDFAINNFGLSAQECYGVRTNVNVTIRNNSSKIKNNITLILGFTINDSDTTKQTVTIPSVWFPNTTEEVALSGPFELTTLGNNVVKVFIIGSGDLNATNDIFTKNVDVKSLPVVDFGNDTIYVPIPYILDAGSGFITYQWQDFTTDRYFNVVTPGLYEVTVANLFNCITVESVVVLPPSDIRKYSIDDLSISYYPNPVTDVLHLNIEYTEFTNFELEIIDINNRLIWSDKKEKVSSFAEEIDFQQVIPGIYFLRIISDTFYWVEKIVVE